MIKIDEAQILENVRKNKSKLEKLLEIIRKSNNEEKKLKLLFEAAKQAADCGILSSRKIEDELLKISQNYSIDLEENFKPNSFLHVITTCYTTGGHTRVCERWIKNSPENQIHSVILTNQKDRIIPDLLRVVIDEKGGDLIVQNKKSNIIEKSLELRKIASSYDKIILHINMDDLVPMIAFGTNEFKRPIIFFNHADHVFWLGVGISDIVVNLRTFAKNIDQKYRGTKNNFVLPLPIDEVEIPEKNSDEIKNLKKDLGFDLNSKVIVTVASSYKFTPFDEYDFVETAKKIIDQNPGAVLLAIGPSPKEKYWIDAQILTNGRIKAIGVIPNNELEKYLQIADLALDSFPYGSATAFLDIAKYDIPCLSLSTSINQMDSLDESGIYCESIEDLMEKVFLVLSGDFQKKLYSVLCRNHFVNAFSDNISKLYENTPKNHEIRFFNGDDDRKNLDDFEILRVKMDFAKSFDIKKSFVKKFENITNKVFSKFNF